MATIFDYLKWRGDLTLEQSGFNPVDALILSRVSYLPFAGVVLGDPLDKITIGEAAGLFFTLDDPECEVYMPQDADLLRALTEGGRFRDMYLSGYRNEVDHETQKQFAAVIIDTRDGAHFISYRGTDTTLVGWKEDFNMSFTTPVPAQTDAVGYLEEAAGALTGALRIGGHSKGGNLAAYAASFCAPEVQERIVNVYNNDGPGFDSEVIAREGYAGVKERIQTFVPQSSVVGMLLEHEEEYMIVRSTQLGLMQHDLYSWEVMRDDFIYLETVTNSSRFIDRTVKDWTAKLEPAQREQVIDAIYNIFRDTNAQTLKELTENWYKNALPILKSFNNMDEPLKHIVSQTLLELVKTAGQNVSMLKPKWLQPPQDGML